MLNTLRRLGLEFYAFFTAPFVVRNCLGMLGAFALFLIITLWWLRCYTNHGESLEVPSYVGMSYREAARKASNRNFEVSVSDSIYMPGKPPGEVISQNPEPESRVKEGRTLYFVVTKNNPDIIILPNLVGSDDYDLYSRKLSRLGLKPRIFQRIPEPRLEPNTIVEVMYRGDTITDQIRRGFKVEMGAPIDFVVSERVTLNVSIPDCVCQTYDAAKFLIQASNLSVGAVVKDASVTDELNAYVWRQTPAYDANGTLRVGEQVDLYITQQRPARCGVDE